MANKSVSGYDITIPERDYTIEALKLRMNRVFNQWVFQLEEGDGGYRHYQCRVRFGKDNKIRLRTLQKKGFPVKGNWSITSKEVYLEGNNFYVMKEKSRIAGPWCDTDDIKVLTRQLKDFLDMKMRPYQRKLTDLSQIYDPRTIYLVWDTIGNIGKSILSEYLEYENWAEEVPPYRLMDDIFQWVCTRPIRKCYIVDMPRGMKKDRLGDFYSGIEVIKNGVAYDKRYKGKKIRFDRPQVFVFTNTLPEFKLMSKDRWIIWKIKNDYTVKEYKPSQLENLIEEVEEGEPENEVIEILNFSALCCNNGKNSKQQL